MLEGENKSANGTGHTDQLLLQLRGTSPLPSHIAIIMDGNGRWAAGRNLPRIEGHKAGALSVRRAVEGCRKLGIKYLTLFSFSSENFGRSAEEVGHLMRLFRQYLESELQGLIKNGIRLRAIGDLSRLPPDVQEALSHDIEQTSGSTDLELVLAISYSGRDEIVAAAQKLAQEAASGKISPSSIDQTSFASAMWSAGIPDPDLLIRTSGEVRISNFLLWQLAYTEIVVVPEFWPDFDEKVLARTVCEFQTRERRYGLTNSQLEGSGS